MKEKKDNSTSISVELSKIKKEENNKTDNNLIIKTKLGEESTLNNAARYISSIKHQDLKYMLEAKVKEA